MPLAQTGDRQLQQEVSCVRTPGTQGQMVTCQGYRIQSMPAFCHKTASTHVRPIPSCSPAPALPCTPTPSHTLLPLPSPDAPFPPRYQGRTWSPMCQRTRPDRWRR
jgi:hypothetical protein